jgi:anti-anti-sigma regulatory factor
MNVKINTKEKFHVIHIQEPHLTAIMTGELGQFVRDCRKKEVGNIILHLGEVERMDPEMAEYILNEQLASYEMQHSFVVCCLKKELETWLDQHELLELMNVTRTESEAWDIVQMEEIEREFLD